MTDVDFEAFATEVKRLAVVLRLRAAPFELAQITRAYFGAMRPYSLTAVTAGADEWIRRGERFPKPKQWIDVMPTPGATVVRELTSDEADDWLAAERRGWERSPCDCVLCLAAGVDDRPLRFVPELEDDGRDVRARIGVRVITRGHWAHGEELARWYQARQAYVDTVRALPTATRQQLQQLPKLTFLERIAAIYDKPREPGEEG
jgi:hypothetical protein